MLKIIKEYEELPASSLITMLFGQPNIGKTSTAFTANNVLLLDTDRGSKRSAFRKDVVLVDSWNDIANITAEDLKGYDTIAIDTVGRAIDFLSAKVISDNAKMAFNGVLNMQGWGQVKSIFMQWTKMIITMKIDIVLIAHDKEDKSEDQMIIRPDIAGGSKDEMRKICDLMGYMYWDNGRVLSFNKTNKWIAKNIGLEPDIHVPDFNQEPQFLGNLLKQAKQILEDQNAQNAEIAAEVAEWREEILELDNFDDFIVMYNQVRELEDGPTKKQIAALVRKQARLMNIHYNQEKGWHQVEKPAEDASEQDSKAETSEEGSDTAEQSEGSKAKKTTKKAASKKKTTKKVSKKTTAKKTTKKAAAKAEPEEPAPAEQSEDPAPAEPKAEPAAKESKAEPKEKPKVADMSTLIDRINGAETIEALEEVWEEIEETVEGPQFTAVYKPIIMAKGKSLSDSEK